MNKRVYKYLAAGTAALLLSSCAMRTTARVPATVMPKAYAAGQGDPAIQAQTADLAAWWTNFHDSLLDSLVERAVKGNIDLRIARERVVEARATRSYTSATRQLPTTGFTGGFTARGVGTSGIGNAGFNSGLNQNFTSSRNTSFYQTGFDSSYEIDFFGGARAAVKAAEADAQASAENLRGVLVTVTSETARNYLDLREAQERLAVAKDTLRAQEETLRLTELRLNAGLTSQLDTSRARAQAESTRAAVPALEAQAQQSVHAIALLLGEQPQALQASLATPGAMPAAPPVVPVGLPSDLLRRRPDIREAERQIAGSAARVGVAVSNFYPKFALTGQTGGQSGTLLNLLSGAAHIWSFGTSFNWELLNYPATKANLNVAESVERQNMANYEKTVLTALKDVEDALAGYTKEKERQTALQQAVDANRKAVELANLRYKQGLSNFLDVLDAQRSLYAAQDALEQNRAAINVDLVALYKALGGGW